MIDLIERIEVANGPSFALDTEIAYAINHPLEGLAKPYTASLDSAIALVPEGWGWMVSSPNAKAIASGFLKKRTPVHVEVQNGCDNRFAVAGATPALGLCAAALRARMAMADAAD